MKKKLIVILGVVLAVYAAGELTNSELPTLSSLTDLTQIDSGNAAGVLADPLDGSMTITSADLNAKFKAVEVLLAQAPSGGGSAADIDYSLCNTYSVTHTAEGVELTDSTDATGLASVFQLSECATMGCDVDSFRSTCVDGGGCADAWGGGNPLNDDGAPGLCGTLFQDGFNFYGTDCTVFTNKLACYDALSLGVDQYSNMYDCRWAESGCFDVSFDSLDFVKTLLAQIHVILVMVVYVNTGVIALVIQLILIHFVKI